MTFIFFFIDIKRLQQVSIFQIINVYKAFLYFVLMYVPAGLLTGTIFTHHRYGTYRREKLRKQREREEAERKEKEEP